jgi:hypothetical protein
MPTTVFPHFAVTYIDDVCFDRNGIGLTPRHFDEAAIWVQMRPSVFLSIASPLDAPRTSLNWLKTRLDAGESIAPAELRIRVQSNISMAISHEGRHRMTNLRSRLSDCLVPVRISLQHVSEDAVSEKLIARLRQRLRSQRGRDVIEGPVFEDAEIDMGGLRNSGVPPPWQAPVFGCPVSTQCTANVSTNIKAILLIPRTEETWRSYANPYDHIPGDLAWRDASRALFRA